MFDYQAGEKYKLTLIMVGMAGVMAGMFFTMLLMPEQPHDRGARQRPKWADHPDVTGGQTAGPGRGRAIDGYQAAPADATPGAAQAQAQQMPFVHTDQDQAVDLITQWLDLGWDFNSQSAMASQEKAMQYMTSDCAEAYRNNIWTQDMSQMISQSGVASQFVKNVVKVGEIRPDGAVVVLVEGKQILEMPGRGQNAHDVKLEYLVKQDQQGHLQIAGISEGTKRIGL